MDKITVLQSNRLALLTRILRSAAPVVLCGLAFATSGCASGLLNLASPSEFSSKLSEMISKDRPKHVEKEEDNDFETRLDTPLLKDYISVTGNNMIPLRGVGLVVGLDGTGGDPPPSHLRKALLDEMARRKIPHPSAILASRNTALVMITAYLPAMVRDGQKFDVRVTLPPNSEATSLKGGWLLETRLAEEQSIAGRGNVKGHEFGMAYGAILTALGTGGNTQDAPAMLRRGSIPGGATSVTERDLEIILRNDFRGLKTSKSIENTISARLHHYDKYGQRIAMAEAKTDLMLALKVHPLYRNNFPRYQQMIRSIALRESDVARRMRTEKLSRDILDPSQAANSALQLEAIGRDAIPSLQAALLSDSLEVRFHAAQSLAYLEDSSGVNVLKQAALEEPAFRVYALAALSVVTDADGVIAMRELLSAPELETRYGAVRALKENSPSDHALGTKTFANQFVLHAVESSGPPAVHVVRYREPEVVVFGGHQELQLPAVLNAGSRITVNGKAGDNKVTITRYELNKEPVRREASTNLVEIIEAAASLDASYPDIVQMLLEAEKTHNLIGELGIDRLPQAGRMFKRGFGKETSKAKLGTPSLTPGLFDRVEDSDKESEPEEESALARMFSMAPDEEDSSDSSDISDAGLDLSTLAEPGVSDNEPTAMNFEGLDLTEEAADDVDEEFHLEETNFKEPVGNKMRRLFFSPFSKK